MEHLQACQICMSCKWNDKTATYVHISTCTHRYFLNLNLHPHLNTVKFPHTLRSKITSDLNRDSFQLCENGSSFLNTNKFYGWGFNNSIFLDVYFVPFSLGSCKTIEFNSSNRMGFPAFALTWKSKMAVHRCN